MAAFEFKKSNKIGLFFAALISCILVFSCGKKEPSAPEDEQIEAYITSKKLVVTEKTSSGLRFIRTAASTGAMAMVGQTVSVKYAGRLLSDAQFDAGTFAFKLGAGSVIKGFDEGIAKMKVGEKATLIFPSSIGYGTSGAGSIPANAPLLFDIEVLSAR